MERLVTPEELERAEAAARRVFRSFDAMEPFTDRMEARMLIYPIDYTMLEATQFEALALAAAEVGDRTAYLVPYGSVEAGWGGTYDHSLVRLGDYGDYKRTDALILEHLLYSPQGTWGLMTSDGEDAVVGGPHEFVETLRRYLPESEEEMARAFVRDSHEMGRAGGSIEWLDPLLVHLYGEERASKLWHGD